MTPLALEAGDNPHCHNLVRAQAVCTRVGGLREPSRRGRPSPRSPASSLGHAALPNGPPRGGRTGDLDRCLAARGSTEPAAANGTATSCATDVGDARIYPDEEAPTAPNRSRPDSAGRARDRPRCRSRLCRRRGAQAAARRRQLAAARRRARRQPSGRPPAIWLVTPSAIVGFGTAHASPTAIPPEDDWSARQRRRLSSGWRGTTKL